MSTPDLSPATRSAPDTAPDSAQAASGTRLWLRVFGAGVLVVTTLLLWTLLTPPFRGDLTRLGRLSETAFGPTLASTPIDASLRAGSTLQDADVLVIGDSFSAPLLWQSVLVAQGLKVATANWLSFGPLCADLGTVLRAQGFRGRKVVVESVERGLAGHLEDALACAHTRPGRIQLQQTAHDWPSAGPLGLNTRETLFTGLLTHWHTRGVQQSRADEIVHRHDGAERVRIQRVPEGCEHFSHRLCAWGLFFADDRTARPFGPAAVDSLTQLARRHADLDISWLVMPNKSSVYLEAGRSATVGAELEARGLGPDLFADFVSRSRRTRDLYSPNDTHTSPDGYRVVGQRVRDWLR